MENITTHLKCQVKNGMLNFTLENSKTDFIISQTVNFDYQEYLFIKEEFIYII